MDAVGRWRRATTGGHEPDEEEERGRSSRKMANVRERGSSSEGGGRHRSIVRQDLSASATPRGLAASRNHRTGTRRGAAAVGQLTRWNAAEPLAWEIVSVFPAIQASAAPDDPVASAWSLPSALTDQRPCLC